MSKKLLNTYLKRFSLFWEIFSIQLFFRKTSSSGCSKDLFSTEKCDEACEIYTEVTLKEASPYMYIYFVADKQRYLVVHLLQISVESLIGHDKVSHAALCLLQLWGKFLMFIFIFLTLRLDYVVGKFIL